jgi:hypothetical protein
VSEELTTAALAIVDKLIPLAAVGLGWLLGTRSQRRQRRLDALDGRFEALRQLMEVADNVPHDVGADGLYQRLTSDAELQRSLGHRLVRLLGLRRELPPYLEPKIREFGQTRRCPYERVCRGGGLLPRPCHRNGTRFGGETRQAATLGRQLTARWTGRSDLSRPLR